MRRRRLCTRLATPVAVAGLAFASACGSPPPAGGAGHHPQATTSSSPAGATAPSPPPVPTPGLEGVPAFTHVFVVVMENLGAGAASGVTGLVALANRYQSTTDWYALAHPSLPNYLGLVSGSTWGVTSDCTQCTQRGPDLASQLSGADISWGAYLEGVPGPCFLGPQSADATYAEKHDPFAYFDDVRSDASLCAHLQPLSSLTPLLDGPATAVPRFVWVTPDLCHDGHDCSAPSAATWLTGFVAQVTASAAWKGGVLVVTWDEGDDDSAMSPASGAVSSSGGGGRVLTLVIGPGLPAGRVLPGPYDHYSLLRTVEDAFGLAHLGAAGDAGVAPLTAFFSTGAS